MCIVCWDKERRGYRIGRRGFVPLGDTVVVFDPMTVGSLADQDVASMDRAWRRYKFRGAAYVFGWHADRLDWAKLLTDLWGGTFVHATDPLLVANVLTRTVEIKTDWQDEFRAGLLHGSARAVIGEVRLGRAMSTDDPRLVALVGESSSPKKTTGRRSVSSKS
jgi:hypothetical protein